MTTIPEAVEARPVARPGPLRRLGLDTAYSLSALPIAVLGFVIVVAGLAASAGLLVIWLGLAVLAGTLVAVRGLAHLERTRLRRDARLPLPLPLPSRRSVLN